MTGTGQDSDGTHSIGTWKGLVQDLYEVHLGLVSFESRLGLVWNLYKSWSGLSQDSFKTRSGLVWDSFKTHSWLVWDSFETRLRLVWDSFETGLGLVRFRAIGSSERCHVGHAKKCTDTMRTTGLFSMVLRQWWQRDYFLAWKDQRGRACDLLGAWLLSACPTCHQAVVLYRCVIVPLLNPVHSLAAFTTQILRLSPASFVIYHAPYIYNNPSSSASQRCPFLCPISSVLSAVLRWIFVGKIIVHVLYQ